MVLYFDFPLAAFLASGRRAASIDHLGWGASTCLTAGLYGEELRRTGLRRSVFTLCSCLISGQQFLVSRDDAGHHLYLEDE